MQECDRMNDIPRGGGTQKLPQSLHGADVTYDTFAIMPFSTINERCDEGSTLFTAHNAGEKIIAMQVQKTETLTLEAFFDSFPQQDVQMEGDMDYNMSQEEYEGIIKSIIEDEIGKGEGSSFVTPRTCMGKIRAFNGETALSIYKRLLKNEYGCYWKFLFYDGGENYFIGASPERQLEVSHLEKEGRRTRTVLMNPISGTFRKNHSLSADENVTNLISFLADQKEINELFMVTDEELKMMSTMCGVGGNIVGPLLKEMSHLIHTEYLLEGEPNVGEDNISLLRKSMFAPTVIGSPVGNACKVVSKYEPATRSYYSSCVLLTGRDAHGDEFLDSSITIRTLEVKSTGSFTIRVGATLVNNSIPHEEYQECIAKVKGVVSSLQTDRHFITLNCTSEQRVLDQLYKRNENTSKFWMQPQQSCAPAAGLQGKRIVMSNNEDDFIYMLRHMMVRMGCTVDVFHFFEWGSERVNKLVADADICVVGPGPGDPTDTTRADSKMGQVRAYVEHLLSIQKPFLAVCLGHQVLSHHLGFNIVQKTRPTQGVQKSVSLYGKERLVGFYNAFYAEHDAGKVASSPLVDASVNEEEMLSTRGPHWGSFQFHPESILTVEGYDIVHEELQRLASL
eukprot:TRINITY_DN24884_c0_g2_i1.p1 TRINITY_DN24884_c0_g2~~TRINITY_DN24884_c0_g2_i1.p1  ORF type:complete len:662 (+),score=312.38 TRINITY_DN24884_c0_g2_i1:125-1987(+)